MSTLSLLAAAGCAAVASESDIATQDRPMAGMSMEHRAQGAGMMGQDHAMPPGMNMPRTASTEAEMGISTGGMGTGKD